MSKVDLNVSLINGLNRFVEDKKAFLKTETFNDTLVKPEKERNRLTADEEELMLMFIEDAVLFELCK